MLARLFAMMTVALLLIACASNGPSRFEAEQAYVRHAGPELDRVRFIGSIRGWQPVGDHSLLMSFSRNVYYLFELSPPCDRELRHARQIALKTATRQSISRFDRFQVGTLSCGITSIREVDFEAAQAEIQDLKDQGSEFERTVEHEASESPTQS